MSRVHNFNAGPAVLPLSVVQELAAALPDYQGLGIGLMEMSHRSKPFEAIVNSAVAGLRRVLGVPDDYKILFLQGGASLQFYMHALNLALPGEATDYVITGTWAKKAYEEAKRCTAAASVWSSKATNFNAVPALDAITPRAESVYLHYTSNNTIYGTQFQGTPKVDKPLIADLSSDIASRPVDVGAHALIYAGAQKNLGPSGVTVVILSPWALERSRLANATRPGGLPAMLDYALQSDNGSLYNTPNTFGIFALDRMIAWVESLGGLSAIAARNTDKANRLYAELDRSAFWRPHAEVASRSQMNVTWRLPSEELEKRFLAEAKAANMVGLDGHRSVGGVRASMYNALEIESVDFLVDFMRAFEAKHG